jgi:hypothetical protein
MNEEELKQSALLLREICIALAQAKDTSRSTIARKTYVMRAMRLSLDLHNQLDQSENTQP